MGKISAHTLPKGIPWVADKPRWSASASFPLKETQAKTTMRHRHLAPRVAVIKKPNPQGWHSCTAGWHVAGGVWSYSTLQRVGIFLKSKISTSHVTQPSTSCLLLMRSREAQMSKGAGKGLPCETLVRDRKTPRQPCSKWAADDAGAVLISSGSSLCDCFPPTASAQPPGTLRAGVSCHFLRAVLYVWNSYILFNCLALKKIALFFHRVSSILLANTFIIFICFIFWFLNHLQLIYLVK